MRLAIHHTTRYEFSQGIAHGQQRLRLRPKTTHGQHVLDWHTDLEGAVREVEYDDHHFNHTMLVSVEPGAREVVVTCRGEVETSDQAGIIGEHAGHVPLWCFERPTELTRAGPRIRALVSRLDADRSDRLAMLHGLSNAVREAIAYTIGATTAATSAEEALGLGQGVCQDHAHVFIGAGRLLGVPMRYVGGYLMMNDRIDQEAGHGWAEAHVEGLGWVGFDVSNGISPDARYVRVTTGCDYREAAPVTGIATGAGEISLDVRLSVEQMAVSQMQQ